MAIKYCVVERANPQDREAPKKFYASAIKRGSMGLDGLAERISDSTSASKADTILVLTALATQLHQLLSEGYSVKLQGIGNLRVTLNGIGSDSLEEFGVHLVRKPNIRFLPDKELLDRVKRTSLERSPRNAAPSEGEEETTPGA